MSTGNLIRIGMVLAGCALLLANIPIIVEFAVYEPTRLALPLAIVLGTVVGAVLVVGAKMKMTADKRFVGICMALAGAVFLLSGIGSADLEIYDPDGYRILFYGPAGPTLGVPLLAIGIRVFARERLAGLCMIVLGSGLSLFLIYLPYLVSYDARLIGVALHDVFIKYDMMVMGAVLLISSLAMMWQNWRMPGRTSQR